MSSVIKKLLSMQQKNQIIEIIKDRCRRFKKIEMQYETLFYKPYTTMRHKYTATSAVLSGFAPGIISVDGITSTDLNYGLHNNLVQPELRCENGIFHIYSDGSDLKGKKIIERCKEMNSDLTTAPVFFLIIVHISKEGTLKKVEMCLPDKDGNIIIKDTIYELSNAIAFSA